MRPLWLSILLATALYGQTPKIGSIEFYGVHKVSETKLRAALGVKPGDPLPRSKGDAEDRLAEVSGVVEARLEATCCDDQGGVILYVGIEEKGAPHFELREPPENDLHLPDDIVDSYRSFLSAVQAAVRRGSTAEDLTNGHSLMADPEARDVQLRFVGLSTRYQKELRSVLRTSGDDEQRAIAAYVIGYAEKKSQVVDDLQYALKDADETVRANAIRAMAALGVYSKLHPEAGLKIEPTWFIEMLNSLIWTDRNNAAVALVNLTESRDKSTLDQLRERALQSLYEMARWHHLAHALPAYIILGRVAELPEEQIQDAWSKGQRDETLAVIAKKFKL